MPPALRSSLVGLPEPGRGDAGGLTRLMGEGRLAGPIDALALALCEPFNPPGAGDGLGLVDGGRKDILFDAYDPKTRLCSFVEGGKVVYVCGSVGSMLMVIKARRIES